MGDEGDQTLVSFPYEVLHVDIYLPICIVYVCERPRHTCEILSPFGFPFVSPPC